MFPKNENLLHLGLKNFRSREKKSSLFITNTNDLQDMLSRLENSKPPNFIIKENSPKKSRNINNEMFFIDKANTQEKEPPMDSNYNRRVNSLVTTCHQILKSNTDIQHVINDNKKQVPNVRKNYFKLKKENYKYNLNYLQPHDENKIFIYDHKGEGNFVNKEKFLVNKLINSDMIHKMSVNFASLCGKQIASNFGYNYINDEDFIFKSYFYENNKKLPEIKNKNKKFEKVERLINLITKKNDDLLN